GEAAAAFAGVRAGGPAHDPDDGERAVAVLIGRRAGVALAGAAALARAAPRGSDQAKLQVARLAGGGERRLTKVAGAFRIALDRCAIAAHHEALADRDARPRREQR